MATMSVRYTVIDGEIIAQERGGVRHQLVPDPLGSTVALYDDSGTKTDTFSYWPYGESSSRTGTTGLKFKYIGRSGYYQDGNTLTYVRARYVKSIISTWLSQDPIGLLGGINLYSYCESDPVNYYDSTGLAKWMQRPLGPINAPGIYGHAYFRFKRPCMGSYTWGFFPGTNPGELIVAKDPSTWFRARGHQGQLLNDCLLPAIPRFGIPCVPNNEHKGGMVVADNSDIIFEAALCSCIKESPAFHKNMQYNFGNYVCGSWIEDMWECARRRSQAWYGQLRNDKGVYPYMTREFNLY